MNKKISTLLLSALLLSSATLSAANDDVKRYWNENLQIGSFRLPPPPADYQVEYLDLNGDGKPDAIKSITIKDMPVLWLDDDGDMRKGDLEGDFDNDCLLIDRDKDGTYDLVVKYADLDDDGKSDLQIVADFPKVPREQWPSGYFMLVFDTDHDGIFNYIDWNKMHIECWEKDGLSDFYMDYSGHSMFTKIPVSTPQLRSLERSWEIPFLFYDPDKDGLSEMTLRVADNPEPDPKAKAEGLQGRQVDGNVEWIALSVDFDNDNAPGNDFDLDWTLGFDGGEYDYSHHSHKLKNLRGLPEADKFFIDSSFRKMTQLLYPDHEQAWDVMFNYKGWKEAMFVYDEDDDCARWERVEFYEALDPFNIGSRNGGVDNHAQADASGDRGEWDKDFSGEGKLYVSRFDGRLHLYGAEWGCWRIDQTAKYFQGYHRSFQNTTPRKVATVKYSDTDDNGFFDKIEYDLDGNREFETTISLLELGIDDTCELIDPSECNYKDFTRINKKMSNTMWKNAEIASKVATKFGINTQWYAKWNQPLSLREHYYQGYWMQFYLYKDLEYQFTRNNDSEMLKRLNVAYFSGDWKQLLK